MIRRLLENARGSLSFKLGAAFAVAVLASVGAMGWCAYDWARGSAVQHELDHLQTLCEELGAQIDHSLANGKGLAFHLATARNVQDYLDPAKGGPTRQEDILRWLDLQVDHPRQLSAVFIMSPAGICLASSNRAFTGRDFSFRAYFQEAMTGRMASSDWIIGTVTKSPRIFNASPIWIRGQIAGVLVTEFRVEDVEEAVRTISAKGLSASVFNERGIILTHSEPGLQYHTILPLSPDVQAELKRNKQFLAQSIDPVEASPELMDAFRTLRAGAKPVTLPYRLGGQSKWGTLTPLTERPWTVAVAIPQSTLNAPMTKVLVNTLLAGAAIALAVFALAYGLAWSLLRPIRTLSRTIGRFGAGDSQAREPVLVTDERGRLAQEFNRMADRLQAHQEDLEALVQDRTLDLETSLAEVKTLRGLIPICGYCKEIRDEEGAWWQLERYIHDHSEAEFSHGICPKCKERVFPKP